MAVARLERVDPPEGEGSWTGGRRTSLTEADIAVLCLLKDFGAMTEADLAHAVPGAPDSLPRLRGQGYIELHDVAERQARWALTDKGLDFVDGDA